MFRSLKEKIVKSVDSYVGMPAFGFDISDRSIKYIKFYAKEKVELQDFGEINLPEGVILNGEIKQEEVLVEILKFWLARDGRSYRSLFPVVSLPEEQSFLRLIQLPNVKKEDVQNAIRWEIEANIPLAPEDLLYDYEIIEPFESDAVDHIDVVITAISKTISESYAGILKRVGWSPLALELESQAIARAVLPSVRNKSAKTIVDMGRNRTSLIVTAGGAIIFTKTIDIGGLNIENNIMKTLGVGQTEAPEVKKKYGLDKKAHDGKLFPAIFPVVAVLADELMRVAEYYQNHSEHMHGASGSIDEILLAGGDANLLGLDTYLSGFLKVQVNSANPFFSVVERLPSPVLTLHRNISLAFATAIGLGLRGVR